jgi:cytochrome c-type biogenesis protein CcmH/NrfF
MRTKIAASALLFILSVAFGAYAATEDVKLFDSLQRDLMCLCGCSTTLKDCPHAQCGYAIPTRKMIKSWISEGKGYDDIIALMIKERGEVSLAAPTKKGFNLVGYAMPFLALVVAGVGVTFTARRWAGKKQDKGLQAEDTVGGKSAIGSDDTMARKLKEELDEFEA